MWWRCWRLLIALTGTAMEYLTPVGARTRSFKEFMEEWVVDQFMKDLADFGLERPWFWDLFVEELDDAHHSFQLGLYVYRTTLWFDIARPDPAERAWLADKYPDWPEVYAPFWDRLDRAWDSDGEAGTLEFALPALCNLCQLPTLFVRPGRNTACTAERDGRRYVFCSEPCRWIFEQEATRFADHASVVDRIVAGVAPGKLTDLHEWMGLDAPTETGKDLRRGLDPWRLEPVPTG
jgi:toluene monooxygenase system protein A